jgi:hypothetical protein
MILAILMNGRYILAIDSQSAPGTIIADGTVYEYGTGDILTFVTGGSRPVRPSTVIISGSSVREYAAALVLLGAAVKTNLLQSLALNPVNPDTRKAKLTGEAAKAEPKRRGVTNAPTLELFVRGLLDSRADTHIQPANVKRLQANIKSPRPIAQA